MSNLLDISVEMTKLSL